MFGQIAAANALSDVYAMGGQPKLALNLLTFPNATLPLEAVKAILEGGNDKVTEAGATIVGGHSIDDKEAYTIQDPQFLFQRREQIARLLDKYN